MVDGQPLSHLMLSDSVTFDSVRLSTKRPFTLALNIPNARFPLR